MAVRRQDHNLVASKFNFDIGIYRFRQSYISLHLAVETPAIHIQLRKNSSLQLSVLGYRLNEP